MMEFFLREMLRILVLRLNISLVFRRIDLGLAYSEFCMGSRFFQNTCPRNQVLKIRVCVTPILVYSARLKPGFLDRV